MSGEMEVEESPNRPKPDTEKGAKENSSAAGNHPDAHMNGISNGYDRRKEHKSDHRSKERSHKSEHRDKDRSRSDKDKSHKSDHRDKDKERHKHSSSSSSKDKERHGTGSSSSKDKDKDKDKDKEKEKEKKPSSASSSSRDKDKEREREHKSSSSTKDKEREKSRDHHKSSSSRDKESSKESKHHSSSSSKDKESSKIRDKDREKHRHSSKEDKDKDKDKSSSKDKDRKHSSDKDKERHSSSHVSNDKDKSRSDKDRHRHDRDKDKHRRDKDKERSKHKEMKEEPKIKEELEKTDEFNHQSVSYHQQYDVKLEIKHEPLTQADAEDDGNSSDENGLYIKEEDEEEDDDYKQENSTDYGNDTRLSELHNTTLKTEEESDEDVPLAARRSTSSPSVKRKVDDSDEDDIPLSARKKVKKESDKSKKKKKKRKNDDDDDDDDEDNDFQKKPKKKPAKAPKPEASTPSPRKKKKKEEEEPEVWKWWEEKPRDDGKKWTFLEHKGPVFAPEYEPLPPDVKFHYNGKEMKLAPETEEIATFYARMLNHDYTTKQIFNDNFFNDWREVMTEDERRKIMDLSKCNFTPMHEYFNQKSEERKQMSKEEKKVIKEKNEQIQKEYGICTIDGHPEKIGNFKIEPPGLFRGRGEHPKMGKLKKRVVPRDVIINCSKDSKFPKPPSGHKWKEIRHDPTVTWLASWNENVQGQVKYVMLNPSSKLKGQKDMDKYNTARKLASLIDNIRKKYREDWKSKEMKVRQRAVALYFIDILALRAGNEKDEDQADTVGCCSLRVEHISLHEKKDDKTYVVVFDFLGKDSIRYYNEVPVEKRVFKNVQLFMESKSSGDDLFDRITTTDLNKHLNELMDGLTAKVFRTYNASITLQQQLEKLTNDNDSVAEKLLAYNRANRAVAILCNHQRSVPKGHAKSMENLKGKIDAKKEAIKETEVAVKDAKRETRGGSVKGAELYEKKKKQLERLKEQLTKLEVQETDKEENKAIALGTSKLNYLDPRISVAWCKKYGVPIEKIYNKTQRDKFKWAIDMTTEDYDFTSAPEND